MTDKPASPNRPARDLLRAWLADTGRTPAALAVEVGWSERAVRAYVNGTTVPAANRAAALEFVTGGRVRVRDWMTDEELGRVAR